VGLGPEDIAEVSFRGFLVLVEILGVSGGRFAVDEVVGGFPDSGGVFDGHGKD
jgi:hypothetical protein